MTLYNYYTGYLSSYAASNSHPPNPRRHRNDRHHWKIGYPTWGTLQPSGPIKVALGKA
jgi:hypothetical protein